MGRRRTLRTFMKPSQMTWTVRSILISLLVILAYLPAQAVEAGADTVIGAVEDRTIIEELILPGPVFAKVTYRGVPDIRILE
jgi:hypothetical protein